MSQSLYIATVGSGSGKSLAVLGVTEMLSHRVRNVGFFRPVIRAGEPLDNDIELIRQRYHLSLPYEALYGATHQQARQMIADGQYQRLLKLILDKFKQVERQCDFVVCEGTDYTGLATAFDSEFDADVAKHLGASLLVVINGRGKASDEIVGVSRAAREAFEGQGCTIAATIVNRVRGQGRELLQQLRSVWPSTDPVYVLPEEQILFRPTVAEIVKALDGHVMYGETEAFNREVLDYKIAAMHLPNFLPQLVEGGLVITPGDRSDVILGTLAAAYSEHYPNVTGLILTGGLKPAPAVEQLIKDFHRPMVPIAGVQLDTFTAAMTANSVRAAIAPDNDRKIAMALGVFESHVDADELEKSISLSPSTWVTPLMFEYEMIERAKASRQHIVLPEGTDERILRASEILLRRRVVDITLLGNEREIRESITAMGLDLEDAHVIDPSRSALGQSFAETYFELRKHKGITPDHAHDTMLDVSYFGTMMVYKGLVNGMVSGAVHTTAHTIRPSFEFIKTQPGCSLVSSVFFMCLEDRVLVYGDCAVNPNPTPEQLADIAISSAGSAQMFGVEPRIAMLSYSTGQSGRGEDVAKVREATRIARQRRPDLKIEGPIQYDAAIDPEVARTKMPDSEIAGHATVFVFPDLNTGNNTYKAVQRSAGAVAVGPVLQGLKKPVNDLSRGCRVPDIVNTVAITAIQAQAAAKMVCGITL